MPLKRAVRRVKNTAAQAGLTNAKRRDNVSGAFRVKHALQGMRVLLVDDVMTTGATAGACAAALKRVGASHVTLLTLARVDRRLAATVRHEISVPESIILGSFEDVKSGSIA